jgi:hypothetical protein
MNDLVSTKGAPAIAIFSLKNFCYPWNWNLSEDAFQKAAMAVFTVAIYLSVTP